MKQSRMMCGFMKCRVLGTREMLGGKKPFLPVETELGLIYPYIVEETEMNLPVCSMTYAHKLGYKITVISGYLFKGSAIL